ncbi:hypothetical protein LSH36_124g01017 [Paralvinella palmiformis]|uniref:Polypeptide N-acetylgalactosaminyltransferase n=1 Tax=Paralvinella palmiformis TaxID=53620 RepID=A0AAD9NAE8_9ANNE|nr:hypothetical protein LSH36_124g01017 [Paralvinella palmiformis]
MRNAILCSRKFTLVRISSAVGLLSLCCLLVWLSWLINQADYTRREGIVIVGVDSSPLVRYGPEVSTNNNNGYHSKSYNVEMSHGAIPDTSPSGEKKTLPKEFYFSMRSDSNDTKFDNTYTSGFNPQCLKRDYGNLMDWPTASIIITFCDNELLSDILHTLHSIIQRTPTSLVKEILLIGDNTTKEDLKQTLDNYCKAVFGRKVHIYRTTATIGLIRARLFAARVASGDVIVMLDAHMEVQEKWLEALLFEIKKDRKLLASITMDWMSPNEDGRWHYNYGPGNFLCYFDWNLIFGYSWPSPTWDTIYKKDSTVPLPSPCSIGNWAMDRSFFIEVGELDNGMQMWGGENIDLAIRTWLFGGRSVLIPCSHAAHQERPNQREYRNSWIRQKYRNYKRLVEVWFDGYKKYFYKMYPELVHVDPGDLSSRLELKKRAKHNFSWFLKHVYPQLGLYDVSSLAYGRAIFLSRSGLVRVGAAMILPTKLSSSTPLNYVEALHHLDSNSLPIWTHWKDGPIKAVGHNLCMTYDTLTNMVQLMMCDPCNINQRWRWEKYTPLYDLMLTLTPTGNGNSVVSGWNQTVIRELNTLRTLWPTIVTPVDGNSHLLCVE